MASPDTLDDIWRDGLHQLADPPPFDPAPRERVATRARRLRRERVTTRAVALVCLAAIAFAGAFSVLRDDGPQHLASPVAVVDIDVHPSLQYTPNNLTVPAGVIELRLHNIGSGQHTLAIDGVAMAPPEVNAAGEVKTVAVDLAPGTYTFHCTVPGHAEAGETGTLVVQSN
jgi:plastocyanin